jgi:hypothetical protein
MTLRIPFDVDACRQWLEMHPSPPDGAADLHILWRSLLKDIEEACDEIEWLRAERRLPS